MTMTTEPVAVVDEGRPSEKLSPGQWAQRNLFGGPASSIITVVVSVVGAYLAYRLFLFVFVNGQWEPVRRNFENFIVGNGMREERWRLATQLILTALAGGLLIGNISGQARDTAEETGEPAVQTSIRTYLSSYWSIGVFLFLAMVTFVRTATPWLLLAATIVAAVLGWFITRMFPRSFRGVGYTLALLSLVIGFQALTGTLGWAWFYTTLALVPALVALFAALDPRSARSVGPLLLTGAGAIAIYTVAASSLVIGLVALAVVGFAALQYRQGDVLDSGRLASLVIVGGLVAFLYRALGLEGVDWSNWGGLHLSLVVTVCSLLLAFPFGVLLALGRRSNLPAVKVMCTLYIEFFRGAPLITFLLAAQFFLGFFLNTTELPSLITRAVAALTLFTSAYIAEIVRGGLQAVPKGQVEAGQAMGLSADKITRLIVMPQALRAVIPAMVGQFISLFKDTTLLTIIGIADFLQIREILHSQPDFRALGIAESLVFVAFGFWAICFTMSRESQRLERRLGVGQR